MATKTEAKAFSYELIPIFRKKILRKNMTGHRFIDYYMVTSLQKNSFFFQDFFQKYFHYYYIT